MMHCTDCFNEDNDAVQARFLVITKVSRNRQYFCRAHMARWFDSFTNSNSHGYIPYEVKRLRKLS